MIIIVCYDFLNEELNFYEMCFMQVHSKVNVNMLFVNFKNKGKNIT